MNTLFVPFYSLLMRIGARAKIGLHYSTSTSYSLIFCNQAAAELFGMQPHSVEADPLTWDQLPPMLQHYLVQGLEAANGLEEEKMPPFLDQDGGSSDPHEVTLYYQAYEMEGEEDYHHFYLFCLQRSSVVESLPTKALEASKLETIGELASGVAHDFNNLIMGMQGNAQLILSGNQLLNEDRLRLVNIIRGCTAGATLTKSLLGYAKRQSLEIAKFDIALLVKDVANLIGLSLGSTYKLHLVEPLGLPHYALPVVGCYSSLSHCLLNLVKNARDAMPNGGTISIAWAGDSHHAILSVIDSGVGIAPQDMEHIFEPFYTTKKQGTGLGLAMAQSILHQHNGEVKVESTLGQGTRVSLFWPRGDIESPVIPTTDSRRTTGRIMVSLPKNGAPVKPQLAFLADDDEIVCAAVAGMLTMLGYQVRSFPRAEEALAALTPNFVPDLLVTDYHMPGMDGTEFIRYWHEDLPALYREKATQFILISGHPALHFANLLKRHPESMITLLQKPFTIESLSEAIKNRSTNLEQILPETLTHPVSTVSPLTSLLRKASNLIKATPS